MDRMRPVYARQKSIGSPGAHTTSSPMASPYHRHVRSGSSGSVLKKPQNTATKVAAQRLAQVMSHQSATDSDEEEDDDYDMGPAISMPSLGLAGGRAARPRPTTVRSSQDQPRSIRSTSGPQAMGSVEPPSSLSHSVSTDQLDNIVECPLSARPGLTLRPTQSANLMEQVQPPSAHSTSTARSPRMLFNTEQPLSARSNSAGLPNIGAKPVSVIPPSIPVKLRPQSSLISVETPHDVRRDKRLSLDMKSMKFREPAPQQSASALQDELDMLQEENESLLEKLRLVEEKGEEAEARARQLEKQVANLGEGVSMDARLLSRKEAALQQREAALKFAKQTYGGRGEEIQALRMEAEVARDEATSAEERLQEVENENKSLRIMTQRLILTPEEKEEVFLKKCWLARYWSLCVTHEIYSEIASARHEYWSSFAPNPDEVVLAIGKKANDENSLVHNDVDDREKLLHNMSEVSADNNIESMLFVEKGLRELSLLKIGEAVTIALAIQRQSRSKKYALSDDLKLPSEGQNICEVYELSQEEAEDVRFKRAWLMYFWRRAKNHGVEADIAEEQLQFWINHNTKPSTSNDAVDVERGLVELRKLGIENQLWEASRKAIDEESENKMRIYSNY